MPGWLLVLYLFSGFFSAAPARADRNAAELRPAHFLESRAHYEEVREKALEILRRYPPKKYFYIGVGRSPAPLMAFFHAAGIEYRNLPLSDLNTSAEEFPRAQVAKALKPHFHRFLPSAERLGKRRLLVIDFAITGQTLFRTIEYLRGYLQAEGRSEVLVRALGLVRQGDRTTVPGRSEEILVTELLRQRHVGSVEVGAGEFLAVAWKQEIFDTVAEYGKFSVRSILKGQLQPGPHVPQKRGAYRDLVSTLREHYERDEAARAALTTIETYDLPAAGACDERALLPENPQSTAP